MLLLAVPNLAAIISHRWKAAVPTVSTIVTYSSFRTSNHFCWYHIQIISQVLVECHKTIQNGVVSSPFLVHVSEFYWQKINHILKNQSHKTMAYDWIPSHGCILRHTEKHGYSVVAPVSGMARQSGFRGDRWATWAPVTSPEWGDTGETFPLGIYKLLVICYSLLLKMASYSGFSH